jgi:ABC-type phosphate/phosphonate transport system substrate-binding protein
VVPAESPIHDLASFRGHKVCFVDLNSTSGFLYPRAGLVTAGLNPDKDITPVMTGGTAPRRWPLPAGSVMPRSSRTSSWPRW